MKIESSALQLASTHKFEATATKQSTMTVDRPIRQSTDNSGAASSQVSLSDTGIARQLSDMKSIRDNKESKIDSQTKLIKDILESILGEKISTFGDVEMGASASSEQTLESSQTQASGTIETVRTYAEHEATSFAARGEVVTESGKRIQFDLSFTMSREFKYEERSVATFGNRKLKDPLVLNFDGQTGKLSPNKFAFDLDADGKKEKISFVEGSAFLFLDKNSNNKVDNGSELFGALSGNGFADLKAFDADGNNWIDENDQIYSQLKLWSKDGESKDQIQTLKAAHVGAINLQAAQTQFELNQSDNTNLGVIRSTGVWLTEEGQANSIQQIDLAV